MWCIPGDVWLKAEMYDAELKIAGHISKMKLIMFVMDQENKMDASMGAMNALIASFMELFPTLLESLEDGETSSSYFDLIPQDIVEIHGSHGMRVFPTGGRGGPCGRHHDTLGYTCGGSHVAGALPPSPPLDFKVISRTPPPLYLEVGLVVPPLVPHGPALLLDNQLDTPFAPDFVEVVDLTGMISRPSSHNVHVTLPFTPSLPKDRAARSKKRKLKKKEAKLKKQKDRE